VKINLQRAKAQFQKYQTLYANPAPGGGMHPVCAAVCSLLLEWQETRGVKGDLLEIGVWFGNGAGLLNQHRRDDEKLILVDLNKSQERFQANVAKGKPLPPEALVFYPGDSLAMRRRDALARHRDSARFLHIDGEHSFEAVVSDLDLCAELINERGIVAVDDVFTAASACVTEALYYWLARNREKLVMFLVGYQKAYLCSARLLPELMELIYELPIIIGSWGPQVTLCASGWVNDRPSYGLVPFVGGTHQRINRVLPKPSFHEMMFGPPVG
jgi:predicted O-methyltransferase YrrM